MRTFIIITLSVFAVLTTSAQNYNAALIPDSLKENANAVIRFEELHVVIKSIDRAVIRHKYVITILNEAGDKEATYVNSYDRFNSLSDIFGTLFDANGNKIKTIKKRDIADNPAYMNSVTLVTDTRYKTHDFYYKNYPYTVEYEDEQETKSLFFIPDWYPVNNEKVSVQESNFIIEAPSNYKVRLKQMGITANPVVIGNSTIYSWKVQNVKSSENEIFQPYMTRFSPGVAFAPSDISMDGYNGNFETWENIGKFQLSLNKGRDILPDNIKKDVHLLVDNVPDKREKIKLLYHYFQQNTRYISVQLGIGGWQPFDATYVASKKYGDCKALSNYMFSLLKEAGIRSCYVTILAGENIRNYLWEDFPCKRSNHAILCVPNGKDSIWLECTSQINPFGYMGVFTDNRKALLTDENGGHLVNTPVYSAKDNILIRNVSATIDSAGNLKGTLQTHYTGIQQEDVFSMIHEATEEEKKKYLNRSLNLPTYEVVKSDYKEDLTHLIPTVDETLQVESSNYATITGKRLFIKPGLFNKPSYKLPTDKPRKTDIVYNTAYMDIDSVSIQIPNGYNVEAIPKDVAIDNAYGKYSIHFSVEGNKVLTVRNNTRNEARFPAKDYEKIVKYYDEVYNADHSTIVLKKD